MRRKRTCENTTKDEPPEANLSASLVRAAAAIGGTKTEAAGAAFRVGGVQVERSDFALITLRTLNILLQRQKKNQY